MEYKTLWQAEKYHPLEVIKRSGKWFHCRDYENDEGWVAESVVSNKPSVIVKNDNANVRAGPGTEYAVLFVAEKGVSFMVITKKGNWLHVQHSDSERGWLNQTAIW